MIIIDITSYIIIISRSYADASGIILQGQASTLLCLKDDIIDNEYDGQYDFKNFAYDAVF